MCILEVDSVLGVLYRKGGPPKRGHFGFPPDCCPNPTCMTMQSRSPLEQCQSKLQKIVPNFLLRWKRAYKYIKIFVQREARRCNRLSRKVNCEKSTLHLRVFVLSSLHLRLFSNFTSSFCKLFVRDFFWQEVLLLLTCHIAPKKVH